MNFTHAAWFVACWLMVGTGYAKAVQPAFNAPDQVRLKADLESLYSVDCKPAWSDDAPMRRPTRQVVLFAEAIAASGGPGWQLDSYLYPVDPWGIHSAIRSAGTTELMHGRLPQRVERHWPLPTRVTPTMKARYVPGAWRRR